MDPIMTAKAVMRRLAEYHRISPQAGRQSLLYVCLLVTVLCLAWGCRLGCGCVMAVKGMGDGKLETIGTPCAPCCALSWPLGGLCNGVLHPAIWSDQTCTHVRLCRFVGMCAVLVVFWLDV